MAVETGHVFCLNRRMGLRSNLGRQSNRNDLVHRIYFGDGGTQRCCQRNSALIQAKRRTAGALISGESSWHRGARCFSISSHYSHSKWEPE